MLSCFAVIARSAEACERTGRLLSRIAERHPQYEPCFTSDRMTVLIAGNGTDTTLRLYRLAQSQGVVIGRLFRRSGQSLAEHVSGELPEHDSRQIAATSGRHLVENYWGRYTAFLTNPARDQHIALSDPSGALPLYSFETDAYLLFFSNSADFHDLGLTTLTFNTASLIARVKSHLLDYNTTGFNEIGKLARGTALVVSPTETRTQAYWHPARFVSRGRTWHQDEAARHLRDTIVQCVGAWASVYDKVGLNLSGGLDSSIVLASLMKTVSPHSAAACHVYYPTAAESDERRWACAVAERAGVHIDCIELHSDDIDPTALRDFSFEAEPVSCFGSVMSGPRNRRFVDTHGVGVMLTGHGGDMIFHQGATASAEDFLWNHGWSWGAVQALAEHALIARTSFYDALKSTIHLRRSSKGFTARRLTDHRINPIVRQELMESFDIDRLCTHWLDELQSLSIGKAHQLASSWSTQHHVIPNRPEWEIPKIHPLMSQPVIEAVASIPAYLFCLNGIDRGLARYAFRHDLPRAVVARQGKGVPHDYYEALYIRHNAFLRESLCSGALMDLGLLDPEALDHALSLDLSENSIAKYNVLELIDLEYWARWWKNRISRQSTITPV